MKKLRGKTKNIVEPILGKVRQSLNILSGGILITATLPKHRLRRDLVITSCSNDEKIDKIKYPIIYGVNNIDEIADGDIVLAESNGLINVMFDNSSSDNCLLLTERCNCDCIMCPQSKSSNDNISLSRKIIRMIDKKTPYLGLTGGEPTLLRHDLLSIINDCKKELPHTSLALLTNGLLFEDFSYVKALASIGHPNLFIEIPIYSDDDSVHDEIIGVKGFNKTIHGLYNLAKFSQKIVIRNVIQKANYRRLPQYAEYIYRNFPFVVNVAFMGLEMEGKAEKNIDKLWVDPVDYMKELEAAIIFLQRANVKTSIYNHQLCILPSYLWRFSCKSISSWKNIYLNVCGQCDYLVECGGFFKSAYVKQSRGVRPLKKSSILA